MIYITLLLVFTWTVWWRTMVFMFHRQKCIILYVTEEAGIPPSTPPPPPLSPSRIILPEDHKMPSLNCVAQFSLFIVTGIHSIRLLSPLLDR